MSRSDSHRGSALPAALLALVLGHLLLAVLLVLANQQQVLARHRQERRQAEELATAGAVILRSWMNSGADDPDLPPLAAVDRNRREGQPFAPEVTTRHELDERPESATVSAAHDALLEGRSHPWDLGDGDVPSASAWGRRESPDLLIDSRNDVTAAELLSRLVAGLAPDAAAVAVGHPAAAWRSPRLLEMRLYRPPLDHDRQVRHGLATVEVLAEVGTDARRAGVQARHRSVVGRLPTRPVLSTLRCRGPLGPDAWDQTHWGLLTVEGEADETMLAVDWSTARGRPLDRRGPGPASWRGPWDDVVGGEGLADPWRRVCCRGRWEDASGASSARRPTGPVDPVTGRRAALVFPSCSLPGSAAPSESLRQAVRSRSRRHLHFVFDQAVGGYRLGGVGPSRSFASWLRRLDGHPPALLVFDTADGGPLDRERDRGHDNRTPPVRWPAGVFLRGLVLVHARSLDVSAAGRGRVVSVTPPAEPSLAGGDNFLNLDFIERDDVPIRVDVAATGRPRACRRSEVTGECVEITAWTTSERDESGPLLPLRVDLEGVLSLTGDLTGTGRLSLHGALRLEGTVGRPSRSELWFDADLTEEPGVPERWSFPMVHVLAEEIATDSW
ncbi:MAG: hypothetical protein AAF533_26405 [Acidobacteriota bacterium]